jgi:ribosomal protein L7/L12
VSILILAGLGFLALVGVAITFVVASRKDVNQVSLVPKQRSMAQQPGAFGAPAPVAQIDEHSLAQVRAALADGRKIEAVVIYREASGLDLKQAKDAVDLMDTNSRR